MTLEQVYLISQIVGVLALLLSLGFVGFQLRQQTIAIKAQTEQAIAANWMALGQLVTSNTDAFTTGILCRDPEFADMGDADRMAYLATVFVLFKHYENMFLQYHKRRIDADEWAPWSNHLNMYFHQPGVQTWWVHRKDAFTPAFRSFLETSVKPHARSPAELHRPAPAQGDGGA